MQSVWQKQAQVANTKADGARRETFLVRGAPSTAGSEGTTVLNCTKHSGERSGQIPTSPFTRWSRVWRGSPSQSLSWEGGDGVGGQPSEWRERVGTLNRKQMASIGARNTEKHRKKKKKKKITVLLLIRPKALGWDGTASDIGLGVSLRQGMLKFSVGFSHRKRKKCFMNRASFGIQSTRLVLGWLF